MNVEEFARGSYHLSTLTEDLAESMNVNMRVYNQYSQFLDLEPYNKKLLTELDKDQLSPARLTNMYLKETNILMAKYGVSTNKMKAKLKIEFYVTSLDYLILFKVGLISIEEEQKEEKQAKIVFNHLSLAKKYAKRWSIKTLQKRLKKTKTF